MRDLISREEVLEVIEEIKCNKDTPKNYGTFMALARIVRGLPTAYDVEKVVEQLENLETMNNEKTHCKFSEGYACAIDIAIEIVKGGGQG